MTSRESNIETALYVFELVGRLATAERNRSPTSNSSSRREYDQARQLLKAGDPWMYLMHQLVQEGLAEGLAGGFWMKLQRLRAGLDALVRPPVLREIATTRDARILWSREASDTLAAATGLDPDEVFDAIFDADSLQDLVRQSGMVADGKMASRLLASLTGSSATLDLLSQGGINLFDELTAALRPHYRSAIARALGVSEPIVLQELANRLLAQRRVQGKKPSGTIIDVFAARKIKRDLESISYGIELAAMNAVRQAQEVQPDDLALRRFRLLCEIGLAQHFRNAALLVTPDRVPIRSLPLTWRIEDPDATGEAGTLEARPRKLSLRERFRKLQKHADAVDLEVSLVLPDGPRRLLVTFLEVTGPCRVLLAKALGLAAKDLPGHGAPLAERLLDLPAEPPAGMNPYFQSLQTLREELALLFELKGGKVLDRSGWRLGEIRSRVQEPEVSVEIYELRGLEPASQFLDRLERGPTTALRSAPGKITIRA